MAAALAFRTLDRLGRRCALSPPVALRAPALARGVVSGETDKFGRKRLGGGGDGRMGQLPQLGPGQGSRAPGAGTGGAGLGPPGLAPPTAPHHRALQRLADLIPVGAGGALGRLRARQVRLRENSDRVQQEEIFQRSFEFLMTTERWTYGNMAAYQRKLLDLMGATRWRRRLAGDDPSILHLEKELRVLEAMTPVELMSNHKRVFTTEAIKLISEKSATTEKFVNQVILEHDILRADRRWYMILQQFGRPLPRTFEDRQWMAEMDRPYSASEIELRDKMVEEHREKMSMSKPKRFHAIWYRKPTCGGNRWSTRPPRWFPSQWRMRPERRARLAGVGAPGGGGDRGRPWGRLAQSRGGG